MPFLADFSVPVVVPVSPRCRVLEEDDCAGGGLHDVYQYYCSTNGLDEFEPVHSFLELSGKAVCPPHDADSETIEAHKAAVLAVKRDCFNTISEQMVLRTVLSRHMHVTVTTAAQLWQVRRKFTTEWALQSLLSHCA